MLNSGRSKMTISHTVIRTVSTNLLWSRSWFIDLLVLSEQLSACLDQIALMSELLRELMPYDEALLLGCLPIVFGAIKLLMCYPGIVRRFDSMLYWFKCWNDVLGNVATICNGLGVSIPLKWTLVGSVVLSIVSELLNEQRNR